MQHHRPGSTRRPGAAAAQQPVTWRDRGLRSSLATASRKMASTSAINSPNSGSSSSRSVTGGIAKPSATVQGVAAAPVLRYVVTDFRSVSIEPADLRADGRVLPVVVFDRDLTWFGLLRDRYAQSQDPAS